LALAVTGAAAIVVSGVIALINPGCLDLVVASSNEKFELLSEIASSYQAPSVDRRCVKVQVIKKASGAAERALARDWAGERQPKPHVWSPGATTWLLLLTEDRKAAGLGELVPRVAQGIMQSPLVIAMPEQMENALRQAEGTIGWEQIFGLARDKNGWAKYGKPWGPFKLGKTDPTVSTSGLHALISVNNVARETAAPDEFLTAVESSVVHYGDTVATFLSNLLIADQHGAATDYVSAIAVEEKQVFDYNRGNPSSKLCRPDCPFLPPSEKLVAIDPTEGTLVADHPYAVLNWTDDARRQAASDFKTHLESPAIQSLFRAEGFRDYRRQAGSGLVAPYFHPSGPKIRWEPPDPPDLVEMLDLWSTRLRKPAHALFVIDIGSSMALSVPAESATRLDLAKRAASDALEHLALKDAVGLWTFPTTDAAPYREVAALTSLASGTSQIAGGLGILSKASDEASFYATVRESVDQVHATFAADRINAVAVLTGERFALADKNSFDRLISYLQHQPESSRVRVFTIGYDPSSESVLRQIAEASGGAFYDAYGPINIGEVLRNALSNF